MATGDGSVQGIPTGADGGGGGTQVIVAALGGQQTPVTGQQRVAAGLDAWPEQQQPSHGLPGLHGQVAAGVPGGAETFLNSRLMYRILESGQSFFGAFSGV